MKIDIRKIGKVKLKKGDIVILWVSVVLALFATASALMRYILPTGILQDIVSASALLIELYLLVSCGKRVIYKKELMYIVVLIFLWLFSVIRTGWSFVPAIMYSSALLLCIMSIMKMQIDKIVRMIIKLMFIMYIIYAIVTVISFFSSSFYINHIVTLFPDSRNKLIKTYNSGMMPGLTSHYSTNGMFLATGLIISSAKYMIKQDNKNRFLLVLFLIALLMTGKRAHLLFGVMAVFVLYFYTKSKEKAANRWIKTIGVILLVLCIGMILISVFPSLFSFLSRFQDTLDGGDVSNGRFDLWRLAISAFLENPVLGIGWKQYRIKMSPSFSLTNQYDAHNVYLQLLCEIGIIGFLIYMAWFIRMFTKTVQLYKKIIKDKNSLEDAKYLTGFSLAFQVFFLLYCFTGNPLYEMYMFIPYFLSCAVTLRYAHDYTRYSYIGKADYCDKLQRTV